MEKPLYPSSNMRIIQGYQEGTHKGSFAIDEAGIDENISKIKAPYTGIIKKIYPNDANEVWLESIEKVEYPDKTLDYMTILFAHADDISDLFVGKRINKGEEFYSKGTKGNTSGNHCHIECGQGKFTGTGWHKNENGYYSINNGRKPEDCLWIDETITIINNNNYNFKNINQDNSKEQKNIEILEENKTQAPILEEKETIEKNQEKEEKNIIEPQIENVSKTSENTTPKLIFTCKKTDLYGIYLNENEKLYIEK